MLLTPNGTVRICGMAPNLALAPPVPEGAEVWFCNDPRRAYRKTRPSAREEFTRWFNLHSRRHMEATYPKGVAWYQQQTKPIVLQAVQPDIPASVAFPKDAVMRAFDTRYFTFSAAWQMAYAALLGASRIELEGFVISPLKPLYAKERPCFFYWVDRLRREGIDVTYPEDVGTGPIGDADAYEGPLYGYETT